MHQRDNCALWLCVGSWRQQGLIWTSQWTWGLWGRCECFDPSNWSQASPVSTTYDYIKIFLLLSQEKTTYSLAPLVVSSHEDLFSFCGIWPCFQISPLKFKPPSYWIFVVLNRYLKKANSKYLFKISLPVSPQFSYRLFFFSFSRKQFQRNKTKTVLYE